MTSHPDSKASIQARRAGARLGLIPAVLFAAALGACGDSSSDAPVTQAPPPPPAPTPAPPPPPAPAVVTGTAAVGAALANANVSVTDRASANVCSEVQVVTTATGTFTCTVMAGKTAPFLVVVADPLGAYPPMFSIAATTPAPGTALVANATPLTTAIVSQLAPNGDPLTLVADPTLINAATLATITTNVMTQIAPVLTVLGVAANYDPFSTQLVAATASQAGNTADQLIEMLKFTTVNGVNLVSTVDNPNGAVPVASASTVSPPALAAPSATVLSLSDSMRLLTNALNRCFALPVATRVVAKDDSIPTSQGGPSVTTVAPDCEEIAHVNYKNNGYSAGQRWYEFLNDATMVGATFLPPEVMLFIDDATAADNDRVILNIRYIDANGNVGNVLEIGRKLPGTATSARATDWWLYGNQQNVESSVRSFVRRNEQFAPNPGTAPFVNASASRFESGIDIFINKDGPGSTGLRAARITGPGLPTAGLVYTRLDPSVGITDQNWLVLRRKDGLTDPASATTQTTDVGNIFRLQRTQGVSGTQATTVRANPNAGSNDNVSFPAWAHPLDYGLPAGTSDYIDFSQLRANTVYQFEFFYDGESAPRYTYGKTMASPVVPATRAANLQWNALSSATLRYLDPVDVLAAQQSSMALSWTANPYAETIRSAGVYTWEPNLSVNAGRVAVERGATSATAVAPGVDFRSIDTSGTRSRMIQLRYRMLDGSYKDSASRFN